MVAAIISIAWLAGSCAASKPTGEQKDVNQAISGLSKDFPFSSSIPLIFSYPAVWRWPGSTAAQVLSAPHGA